MNGWRKSTFSETGTCAEVAAWRKARSSSYNTDCAEVGTSGAVVGVQDTKEAHLGRERTVLEFAPGAWRAFLHDVKGEQPR
jgi:hypothetical protein